MVTLADVARRANVSKMTVSRVLNHPEQVTQELRTSVLRAMDELNYRPNPIAKALAEQRTFIIQVLILEEMTVVEPYYAELLAGIADQLHRQHYALQLLTSAATLTDRCDGYIIAGAREKDFQWISSLTKPCVLFGENTKGIPFVDSDNLKAVYEATHFAKRRGYEELIYIGIDLPEAFASSRQAGYSKAMSELGKETRIYKLENRSTVAELFVQTYSLASNNACFICASDRLALGIERGLQRLGKDIPNEVGVIGFDGFFLDRISRPQLTTMRQPLREMGELSVTSLLKQIEQKDEQYKESHYCQAELIERDSTRSF